MIRAISKRLAMAALLIAAAPLAAPVADAKLFAPETFTLENGLQVVVVTNRRAPIVTHMLYYKVGAADEPAGKSGVAHVLEHLMFKGTETLAPGEFSEIIARNGGQENAFTSWDYTGYYQTIAKDRLEIMMTHEADRMANLVLSEDVVLPEVEVVKEERRSRVDNDPGAQLGEMARATLYLNHPYGTPIIGWLGELDAITTQDAVDFYETWYAPDNAVLVIAGDVTAEEVRPLVERTYGKVAAGNPPERLRPPEPEQRAPRRVELKHGDVRQPSLSIQYLAPSFNTAEENRAYALDVLAEVLSGATGSRLYKSLVIEQKLAASAGAYYSGDSLDLGSFGFYASPRPGSDMEALEAALRAEIDTLIEDGVTAEEVAEAKQRLSASAIYARDSLNTAPRVIGTALATGQTIADVEAWPERIAAVTAEDVSAAARAVLDPQRSVTRVLLPKPSS